jgi:Holliday junction resolvase RusA-like endonuclease
VRRIAFTIPAEPVAQGRPRATTIGGFTRLYQPTETVKWQQQVRLFAVEAMSQLEGEPIQGPVALNLAFYLPRPGRLIHKRRPMPPCLADHKPDLDNLVKAILDGVNGVAFQDDRQVVQIMARKFYAAGSGYGDTRPRVEVVIEEVTEDNASDRDERLPLDLLQDRR